jgi:hypothetical protein
MQCNTTPDYADQTLASDTETHAEVCKPCLAMDGCSKGVDKAAVGLHCCDIRSFRVVAVASYISERILLGY